MATQKKGKGRQKIEITKMTKESNLLVTFSKRRSGLFKKASELCTLCGAEVTIVVFSPGKKAFSFGHPCVEEIIDRFFSRNSNVSNYSNDSVSGVKKIMLEGHMNSTIRDLNMELTQVNNQLEAAKKRGEMLNQMNKGGHTRYWWESPIETLQLDQLDQLGMSLLALKETVKEEADKIFMVETLKLNNNIINNPFVAGVGSSSNAVAGGWHTTNKNRALNLGYGGGTPINFCSVL